MGDPGKSFLFFLMVISSNLRGLNQASSSFTGGGSLVGSSGHRAIKSDHLAKWSYTQNKSPLNFRGSTVSSVALENPVT